MKKILLALTIVLCNLDLTAQSIPTTPVEVQIYLPAHLKSFPAPSTKLEVYFMTFISDTVHKNVPKKVIARKIKDNLYSFDLPQIKLWHIGFSYGNFSSRMLCVNNEEGEAARIYDFNLRMDPGKTDFNNIKFLPPCLNNEEE
jgi:hypothetical protein